MGLYKYIKLIMLNCDFPFDSIEPDAVKGFVYEMQERQSEGDGWWNKDRQKKVWRCFVSNLEAERIKETDFSLQFPECISIVSWF